MKYIEYRNGEDVDWFVYKIRYIRVKLSESESGNSKNKNRGIEMGQDEWTHGD